VIFAVISRDRGLSTALGSAVSAVPRSALRLTVGGLLLTFGLPWQRDASLRAVPGTCARLGGLTSRIRASVGTDPKG